MISIRTRLPPYTFFLLFDKHLDLLELQTLDLSHNRIQQDWRDIIINSLPTPDATHLSQLKGVNILLLSHNNIFQAGMSHHPSFSFYVLFVYYLFIIQFVYFIPYIRHEVDLHIHQHHLDKCVCVRISRSLEAVCITILYAISPALPLVLPPSCTLVLLLSTYTLLTYTNG